MLLCCTGLWLAAAIALEFPALFAQPAQSAPPAEMAIRGIVQDSQGQPVADAIVDLQSAGKETGIETNTDTRGKFTFQHLAVAEYLVTAQIAGARSSSVAVHGTGAAGVSIALVMQTQKHPESPTGISRNDGPAMEFSDQPQFSVAGVTDWTAAGGHGSDTTLRTSESLTNATVTLKPEAGAAAGNALAATHRLAAEADERRGDPLGAVREFEQAAKIDPSEQNQFAWASELLLHRAIWQAEAVFRKGADAYPKSLRMQAGLGAALFAGARYEDAASQMCKASDLDPADSGPYLLLGKIQIAAPDSLGCVKPKLARFAQLRPDSSAANYLYAMALLKEGRSRTDAQTVELAEKFLNRAISLDPTCSEGFLQLGILASAHNDNQGAIRFYTQAIDADPRSADAHYRLGVAYRRLGEQARAEQQFALQKQLEQQQDESTETKRKAVKQFLFADPAPATAAPSK